LVDRKIKRLFLTFTPKDVTEIEDSGLTILSMNDERVFGKVIVELKLRDLINKGVLPDYVIWALASNGEGLFGKLEQVLQAWDSREINHLVIFVECLSDKEKVKQYLEGKIENVYSVERPEDTKRIIEEFTNQERAIIIDCKRLGEGVDIPIADSVAIMYPKESVVDIVQMLLRAGRWYEYKSVFHVLLPHTEDEDMSGIQNVLIALAEHDEALRGEILLIPSDNNPRGDGPNDRDYGFKSDGHIQCDMLSSSNVESMKKCFQNVRSFIVPIWNKKEIQHQCIANNINTSKKYLEWYVNFKNYPKDPRFSGMSWFDFLNYKVEKMDMKVFAETVIKNKKITPSEYELWHEGLNLPSLQNIRDGYFGEDKQNFMEIIEKFVPVERRRR